MDDIVRQALSKWPNVPHCTGWLLLDRRGEWRLRDDAAQAAGELGSPIRHAALNAFIGRNYECDAQGQWFFQNGPQRVYVELAYTPWVVRLAERDGQLALTDQTGAPFEPDEAWLDDAGGVLFRDAGAPPRAWRRCTTTISGCSPIMRTSTPRRPCCAGATGARCRSAASSARMYPPGSATSRAPRGRHNERATRPTAARDTQSPRPRSPRDGRYPRPFFSSSRSSL